MPRFLRLKKTCMQNRVNLLVEVLVGLATFFFTHWPLIFP